MDVALRREELTPEAQERQAALDRSWADAQRALSDPAFREGLERTIERLDTTARAAVLSREEFLARTSPAE